MCVACERGGPQIPDHQRRWLLRGDGVPRGSLSLADIESLRDAGVISAEALISREAGAWHRLREHPDFRAAYIPGSSADVARRAEASAARTAGAAEARQRRFRVGVATALAAASLCFAAYSISTGMFIIPVGVTEQITGAVEPVGSPAEDPALLGLQELPFLETLPPPKSIKEGLPALLHTGAAGLMAGTNSGLMAATDAYERAVSIAPLDPEALAGLATAYAILLPSRQKLLNPMTALLSRGRSLGEGSPAMRRALAMGAIADGHRQEAIAFVAPCGEPVDAVVTGGVDLGCAIILAELRDDADGLALIGERFPGIGAVDVAAARVALRAGDMAAARRWGESLTAKHPEDPVGWRTLLLVASEVGDWPGVRAAGERLAATGQHDLEGLHTYAQVLQRVYGRSAQSGAILAELVAYPHFGDYAHAGDVFADAAEAALSQRQWDAAVDYASRAMDADAGTSARLLLAWAWLQRGDRGRALEVISELDIPSTGGNQEARLHLGAARLYLALDDLRGGQTELDLALQADPLFLIAHIDRAASKLRTDDFSGAIEALEDAAYSESILPRRQQQLNASWLPPTDTGTLRATMEAGLRADARFAGREGELSAVIAWATGDPSARGKLEAVINDGGNSGPAAAALAQIHVDGGDCRVALPLLEKALGARPGAPTQLAMRGYCLTAEERGLANQTLEQALTKAPGSLSVLYWTAMSAELSKPVPEARVAWEDYLRAAPGDVLGREALARLHKP